MLLRNVEVSLVRVAALGLGLDGLGEERHHVAPNRRWRLDGRIGELGVERAGEIPLPGEGEMAELGAARIHLDEMSAPGLPVEDEVEPVESGQPEPLGQQAGDTRDLLGCARRERRTPRRSSPATKAPRRSPTPRPRRASRPPWRSPGRPGMKRWMVIGAICCLRQPHKREGIAVDEPAFDGRGEQVRAREPDIGRDRLLLRVDDLDAVAAPGAVDLQDGPHGPSRRTNPERPARTGRCASRGCERRGSGRSRAAARGGPRCRTPTRARASSSISGRR